MDDLKAAQDFMVQKERLNALGEMASGIAHDFNNTLVPILGYSDMLLNLPDKLDDREKTIEWIKNIHRAAGDASEVVNRMREFYRQRDHSECFVPVDLEHLIKEVISLTQPKWKDQALARGKIIRIHVEFGQVPAVPENPHEIRETLTNLIFNAVDAMPEGGDLTLGARQEGKYGIMEICDTGTGMSEEVRQRCLEPFFTTKGDRGTGLGLGMVHGIIRRHEGEIEIQSKLDQGTTFRVKLPLYKRVQTAPRAETRVKSIPSLHVLVVDDEPYVREVISGYLESDGHTVETAADGGEGLLKFLAGWYDLIITDRSMPEMSGDQLAASIKKHAPKKPVIIMLTGFGEMMNAVEELPQGVDTVIGKPASMEALRKAISSLFNEPLGEAC
jgi:CheY-like chemotaxis protein